LLAVAAAARLLASHSPGVVDPVVVRSQGLSFAGLSLLTSVLLGWAIAAGIG
jgi:hypothetical protein